MNMQYLKTYTDRHGKQRCYIRGGGFIGVALKANPKTIEFEREYACALQNLKRLPASRRRPKKERALTAKLPRWLKKGMGGVYLVKGGERLKIGYSADIRLRIQELQTGCPVVIEFVGALVGATHDDERKLHAKFDEYRIHGEWFEYGTGLADFVALVRTNQRHGLSNSNPAHV